MQKLFSAVLVALMALAGSALAQTFTLKHSFQSPAAAAFNQFGAAVAAVGNNVLVGEPSTTNGGSAYLFDGNTGALLLTFSNPTPAGGELFGRAVAGVGNNALIGAPGANGGVGEAYLFDGTTGALLHTFTIPSPTVADLFGFAVAAVGNNVLIGAPGHDTGSTDAGEAYLFDGSNGALLQTFLNPTPTPATGVPDQFGFAVAGVGNNALIGAPGDDTGATNAGASYLFNGGTGVLLQTFTNPTPFLSDQFGTAVAGAGINALIGAPFDDTGATNAGAAYLFDGASGGLLQTISNPSPNSGDNFGWSVAAFGINVLVLIGTPNGDGFAGKAYLYDGTFTSPAQTFLNPTPVTGDQFGFAVAGSDNNVIIGALGDDTAGEDAGAAYLYSSCNQPPTITLAAPITLWPANRQYTTISVEQIVVSVSDPCAGSIPVSQVTIASVSSDEPDEAGDN
ncbi:FG-GAP repeat protein, partial [candidate division KSB1 bacterium]|nr:FG-GAP repeat protein [candidate division KSB1 bacterium]